jgi:hypothetical protein
MLLALGCGGTIALAPDAPGGGADGGATGDGSVAGGDAAGGDAASGDAAGGDAAGGDAAGGDGGSGLDAGADSSPTYGAEVVVAPDGDDANPGTLAQPFRTLERARTAAHGISDYGTLARRGFYASAPAGLEVSFDGAPMPLARWPDPGDPDPAVNHGFVTVATAPSDTQFTYSGTRPTRWAQAEEVWLHGYWKYMWADLHVPVAAIETGASRITLTEVPGYGLAAGQPYYAENLLEEITVPGEWYLDRTTGILYFWPPADLATGEVTVSTLPDPLVTLTDTHDVTIGDLAFESGRTRQLVIEGGTRNRAERCTLLGAGTDAAAVSGTANGLERCVIRDPGDRGVVLAGGERRTLTAGANFARRAQWRAGRGAR